ncbi:LacI family DNA-binding transcriptional regulator [Anaerosporobacter sp.]|uniref:LacI family DNA-binding transcriptional regulator n=1 Tax=Anaerosporobacter sp. TaxID=1872529 RepID=UPI00286EFAD1|nr:LacI family DNA-binding transcriptional regulator [Anaerosporobacter sp.]
MNERNWSKEDNSKITIDDIARELGVSKTTISRAISGKGRISATTRKRVLNFCEECGYKPNMIARGLAESKTYNIGVVLPDDSDLNEIPFFQVCLLGIIEMATSYEYDVVVSTVGANDITKLVRLVENQKVDGFILTRTWIHDAQVRYLSEHHVPFVVVGTSESSGVIQVDNNHVEACREMTSMLIMQKMRQLSFIGNNSNHIVSRMRYEGFLGGCELNQITPRSDCIYLDCNTRLMVEQAVDDILHKRVDCIICMDDKICSQVLLKLAAEHVKIPRDIRVASLYDSLFLASHNPPITALEFDVKALGNAACKLLIDALSGIEVSRKTLLGYDIIFKASTKQ